MNLLILRSPAPWGTPGQLFLSGNPFCYTLEDIDRGLENGGTKIPGETAIPRGRYEGILSYSPRFQTVLPLLKDVPGYAGVRIHKGNRTVDTDGCVLVGESLGRQCLVDSRKAFQRLMAQLVPASQRREKIWIEVK
jgi:hypothetical protein